LDRSNGLERSILNVYFRISKKMSNAVLKLHVPVELALPRRSLHATSGDPHIALSYVVVPLNDSCPREASACRSNHHTGHTRRVVIRRCTAEGLLPRKYFISVVIIIVITIIVITFAVRLNTRELIVPISTVRFICDIMIF
jgi:hypothetical protein